MMRIYIGWDSNQSEASHVCEYSLRKNASFSGDLDIVHLKKQELLDNGAYFRPEGDPASTEFTYIRFLVPYLEDYKGWSMFVDSDFLFTYDINYLFSKILTDKDAHLNAAYVCKHPSYVPKNNKKFYGKPQLTFPKKNWSSLIIFNNSHPDTQKLTPMNVSNQTPQWLHRFSWTDDTKLGHISFMWNWLVGEYEAGEPTPFGIHFTNGGPFNDVHGQDFEDLWYMYRDEMNAG
jgi:lipopolysaccharide biosynthesis glycosyltransferase